MVAELACREALFDSNSIVVLNENMERNRLCVSRISLICVVKDYLIRVIVIACVRRLEVVSVAVVVVAFALCTAVGVVFAVDMARYSNECRAAYPRKI